MQDRTFIYNTTVSSTVHTKYTVNGNENREVEVHSKERESGWVACNVEGVRVVMAWSSCDKLQSLFLPSMLMYVYVNVCI